MGYALHLFIDIPDAKTVLNRPVLSICFIALLVYMAFCGYLYLWQRSMLYFAQPRKMENAPLMILQRPDARIRVTVQEHEGADAIVYFGGNAEDVSTTLPEFEMHFPDRALYMMHYRGYGGSEGKPTEEAILGDAFALYDEVAKKHSRIVLVGRSLGTGVAVRIAAARPVSRMVLITPYDSIQYVAGRAFPYVPVKWLLKDKWESWRYAPEVSAPTLILMAGSDEVIPAESTERLYAAFPKGIATMKIVADARHNSIHHAQSYQYEFGQFLADKQAD